MFNDLYLDLRLMVRSVFLLCEEGSQTAASGHEGVAVHLALASIHDFLVEAIGGSLDPNGPSNCVKGFTCSWVGVESLP